MLFQCRASVEDRGVHIETALGECHVIAQSIQYSPGDGLVLG